MQLDLSGGNGRTHPQPGGEADVIAIMKKHDCGVVPIVNAQNKNKKVRRLPVIDNGRLVGILSMNDVVMHAEARKAEKVEKESELDYGQTVDALKAIYERPGAGKELIARP